jgi:CRISPR-associated protein Cas2
MFFVISYDIPDDKRRTKVCKLLKNFGLHVQYSVFECDLKIKEYQQLRKRLKALVNKKEDDVRFYFLCNACLPKTVVIGPRKGGPIEAFYIV